MDGDAGLLSDPDNIAVGNGRGIVGRNEGAVDEGSVGGVEVGDSPEGGFSEEAYGEMFLGDGRILDGEGVAANYSADAN